MSDQNEHPINHTRDSVETGLRHANILTEQLSKSSKVWFHFTILILLTVLLSGYQLPKQPNLHDAFNWLFLMCISLDFFPRFLLNPINKKSLWEALYYAIGLTVGWLSFLGMYGHFSALNLNSLIVPAVFLAGSVLFRIASSIMTQILADAQSARETEIPVVPLRQRDPLEHFTKEERWAIVIHEAAHALVAQLVLSAEEMRLSLLSCYPEDVQDGVMRGGFFSYPEKILPTTKDVGYKIAISLAGRAAEDVILHTKYLGSEQDLALATKLSYDLYMRYGKDSNVGPVYLLRQDGVYWTHYSTSEAQEKALEYVNFIYKEISNYLEENQAALTDLAYFLLQRKRIDGQELLAWLQENHPECMQWETESKQNQSGPIYSEDFPMFAEIFPEVDPLAKIRKKVHSKQKIAEEIIPDRINLSDHPV